MDSKLGNFLFYGHQEKFLHLFVRFVVLSDLSFANSGRKIVCSMFKVLEPTSDFL